MDSRPPYPRAILHFDGDSFFASVEQAKDWRLRGKPVVTGGERGAVTSLSYEAKKLGATRGMPMQEIKRRCPGVIVLAGDYLAYSVYARRMYAIARRFTPRVEDYSIDECFADITGLAAERGTTYEAIARAMKQELETALGITFGVGLAPTKTLAKVASKHRKPAGFTAIPVAEIDAYLQGTQVYDVWGLGGALSARLRARGVITALDYARKPDAWLREHGFAKPARATWLELRGYAALSLGNAHARPKSVMKTRTFAPPSGERAFVLSQLSKNVEAACAKVRAAGMRAAALSFYLKTQEFTYHGVSLELPVATAAAAPILARIEPRFDEVFAEGIAYRATGVTLRELVPDDARTPDLFGAERALATRERTGRALDAINRAHGRDTAYLASSMRARLKPEAAYRTAVGRSFLRCGPQGKKSLDIPYLGTVH